MRLTSNLRTRFRALLLSFSSIAAKRIRKVVAFSLAALVLALCTALLRPEGLHAQTPHSSLEAERTADRAAYAVTFDRAGNAEHHRIALKNSRATTKQNRAGSTDAVPRTAKPGVTPRRKCLGSAGSCLDVLTYNVKMISCPPSNRLPGNQNCSPRANKRAQQMIDVIARPDQHRSASGINTLTGPIDVIVINELVKNRAAKSLLRGPTQPLKRKGGLVNGHGYNRTNKNAPNKIGYLTAGGIMILSQYTIQDEHYKVFPKNALKDKSVAHGVVHAEISKHGQTYHVFATHFDTDGGPTNCSGQRNGWTSFQKKEVDLMRKFVNKHAGNEPAIMAGDFNFGVGLQKCASANRGFFGHALDKLDAVELAHPEDTEAGKDFSSQSNDPGRVLDHIMVRNLPLTGHSFAERLRFKAKNNIGVRGGNLSDHHPVYAFLQQCSMPSISSAQTKVSTFQSNPSQQQGGYPINPTLHVTMSKAPTCPDPGLEIHWEVATDADFDNIVFETYDTLDRSRQQTTASTTALLKPSKKYYWRAYLGPKEHWPPAPNQTDGIWNPSKTPRVSSPTKSFRTFDPRADRFENNNRPGTATRLSVSDWTHTHMACPKGGVLPTKSTGKCNGIFTSTQSTGANAPLVAYEKWTLTKSGLTLDEGDVDYYEVELPPLDLEKTNRRVDRILEKNLCATLTVQTQQGMQSNRKIRSDPQFITNMWPQSNPRGKYEVNDPLNVSTKTPEMTCTSWSGQSPKTIRIGAKDGAHWGGYDLDLEIHLKLAHKQYERAVAAKIAGWREAQRMADLQFLGLLRNLDCSDATCRLPFPGTGGWGPGQNPFPDGPTCRVCQRGMPFRVGTLGQFDMVMHTRPDVSVRLLSANGGVVAEAERVAGRAMSLSAEATTRPRTEAPRPDRVSPRTDVRKRLSVDQLAPGTYVLVLDGPPGLLTIETLTLPPKGTLEESKSTDDDPTRRVEQPSGVQITALPKAGAFLSGVSSFGGISGAAGSTLGGAQSVFTWGGSVALGARNGPLNLRLTGLRTTGSLVSTTEGIEATPEPVRENMTLLTSDVVVRPIPRIGVQPYAIGGLGARRLSVRRFDELSGGPQWTMAAQVGVGLDLRLGNVTLGVEVVDYLTGITGGFGDGLQHDAFAFLTLGVPIF